MANKAVVGAVALGVGIHQANEWWKDRNVEKEREERRQLEQDRLDAHLHREMQQMQRNKKKKGAKKNQADASDGAQSFSRSVQLKIEEELKETIRTSARIVPTMMKGRHQIDALKLPLLGTEPKSQDFKLAVALAFADFDSIHDLTSQSSFKHRLGTPLVTLNHESVQMIIRHIKSSNAARSLELGLHKLDQDVLTVCAFHAAINPKVQNGAPFVQLYTYSRKAVELVKRYGFFLTPLADFTTNVTASARKLYMTFSYTGTSGCIMDGSKVAIITNFEGNFKVPVTLTKDSVAEPDFEGVTTITKQRKKKVHTVSIVSPNLELLATDYGLMQSHAIHSIAVERLEYLASRLSPDQELSLQHIAVHSGYEGTLLQEMEDADKHIIAKNQASLEVTLLSTLEACVPPATNQSVSAHQSDIWHFVKSYLRLIQLSYCKTPILGKGPPSHYVPKKSVVMEAKESSIWVSDESMFHGTRRLLEKSERDKIDQARILSKPKPTTVMLVGSSLSMLIAWLLYIIVYSMMFLCFPRSAMGMERMTSLVTTVPLVVLTMRSLVQLLQYPLRLTQTGNDANWGKTLEALTEVIVRHGCIQMGSLTPFENELEALTNICQHQHQEWTARIAIDEFERARKRKKIGYSNYLLLTDALKETVYKTANEYGNSYQNELDGLVGMSHTSHIPSESAIHKKNKKKMNKVTGGYGLPQTLSGASSILRPFICKDEEDSGPPSKLSIFKSVETIAEEYLKFCVGDRVCVDRPSEDDEEELAPEFSSKAIGKLSADLVDFKSLNGSIVSCHPSHCFIHFDGMAEVLPIPIPLSWVIPLDESRINALLRNVFGDDAAVDDGAMVQLTEAKDEEASTESYQDEEPNEDIENESSESNSLVVTQQDRPSTLEDALIQGQWTLVRQKNHYVYKRTLVLPTSDANEDHGDTRLTQTVAFAKTSSDRRSGYNAMSTLRRKDEEKEALSANILPNI